MCWVSGAGPSAGGGKDFLREKGGKNYFEKYIGRTKTFLLPHFQIHQHFIFKKIYLEKESFSLGQVTWATSKTACIYSLSRINILRE